MLKKDLAVALGISGSMVSRLAKQGMPTHSIEAARAWRERHLDPARVVAMRADMKGPPKVPELVAKAEQAMLAARAVLDAGADFGLIAPVLRAALKAVPDHQRHLVGFDPEVMRILCAPLIALCQECDDESGIGPEDADYGEVGAPDSPGRALYEFACGELVITDPA